VTQPDPFQDYDAAYVMGALDPQDRRAFEAHLAGCDQCRAAVAELAGLPGLLAQVPAAQVLSARSSADPLPETLLPRLVTQIRRQRRRRRVLTGLAGAVAAACLAVGIVLTSGALGSDPPKTQSASSGSGLVMTVPGSGATLPVTANVRLDAVSWGTKVHIECTYPAESTAIRARWGEPVYRIVVLPRAGGGTEQVAAWKALAGKTVTVLGSTDLKPADIADIRLIDSRGQTILHTAPTA
jgi:hypothetical protein